MIQTISRREAIGLIRQFVRNGSDLDLIDTYREFYPDAVPPDVTNGRRAEAVDDLVNRIADDTDAEELTEMWLFFNPPVYRAKYSEKLGGIRFATVDNVLLTAPPERQ